MTYIIMPRCSMVSNVLSVLSLGSALLYFSKLWTSELLTGVSHLVLNMFTVLSNCSTLVIMVCISSDDNHVRNMSLFDDTVSASSLNATLGLQRYSQFMVLALSTMVSSGVASLISPYGRSL